MSKYLYHYTSKHNLEKILNTGYLKLTPSNLIKPTDMKIVKREDGSYDVVSEISDHVKPVVWLTDSLDMSGHGLECGNAPDVKKAIRITIPMKDNYKWWLTWAERNRMNKRWMKVFTNGKRYGTWYIAEEPIELKDIYMIEDVKTGEVLYKNEELTVVA